MSKITSVRHKNILLRIAHGEIYYREKLYRYGLVESPNCPRCNEVETLRHKVVECEYVKRIWRESFIQTDRLIRSNPQHDPDFIENKIIAAFVGSNSLIATIHAEILLRIIGLKDDQLYLLRPSSLVRLAITKIRNFETILVLTLFFLIWSQVIFPCISLTEGN